MDLSKVDIEKIKELKKDFGEMAIEGTGENNEGQVRQATSNCGQIDISSLFVFIDINCGA